MWMSKRLWISSQHNPLIYLVYKGKCIYFIVKAEMVANPCCELYDCHWLPCKVWNLTRNVSFFELANKELTNIPLLWRRGDDETTTFCPRSASRIIWRQNLITIPLTVCVPLWKEIIFFSRKRLFVKTPRETTREMPNLRETRNCIVYAYWFIKGFINYKESLFCCVTRTDKKKTEFPYWKYMYVTCYLSSSCHLAHKASTQSRQPALSLAGICTSLQFFHPAFSLSLSAVFLHVVFGLPHFRRTSGVQVNAVL